jgi:hypothetical protein
MLQLEVGKFYKNRKGEKVGPLQEQAHDIYPYFIRNEGSYTEDGLYWNDKNESKADLIEEWKDEETIVAEVNNNYDPVNYPQHYTSHPSGIECIQITRHMGFNLGNAMKYIWRADLKNGLEDLEKAKWYIQDEIDKRKG